MALKILPPEGHDLVLAGALLSIIANPLLFVLAGPLADAASKAGPVAAPVQPNARRGRRWTSPTTPS